MKKIAVIGTVGIPANYGGFETLAEHLVREKSSAFDFTVYCSSRSYGKKLRTFNGANLKYWPLKANGIQSIPYDILSMLHAIQNSEVLLILGVSGCVFLPVLKLFTKKTIIVNMDGLEWKRDKWGKFGKWFYKLSEKIAVQNADLVIADNKVIKEYVTENYRKGAVLIPYGADHTQRKLISGDTLEEFPFLNKEYAFKVCRIEPENNVHLILEAFAALDSLSLVVIGNWNNSIYGKRLLNKYRDFKKIFLLDPIYNQNKLNQIRSNCYVYVHGHSAGGTNPSLIEAMYLQLPILAYGVNYNKETTGNKALYFSDKYTLINQLKSLNTAKITQISEDMFKIAEKRYTWKKIANQYSELFEKERASKEVKGSEKIESSSERAEILEKELN